MKQPPKKISILLGGLVAVTILLGIALLVSSWMSWRTSSRIARAIFMFRAAETGRSVLAAARHFPDSDAETLSNVISEAMPDSVQAFQILDRNARVLFSINHGERGFLLPQAAHILRGLNPRNEVFTRWRDDNGQNPVFEIFRIFIPHGPPPGLMRPPGPAPLPAAGTPGPVERLWCPDGINCERPVFVHFLVSAKEIPAITAAARLQFALSAGGSLILVILAFLFYAAVRRASRLAVEVSSKAEMARLGEVSAVLAHEIRTPLSAIKGYAQLIAEGLPAGSASRRGAETIERESGRLERLAGGLLDFARPIKINLRDADLSGLIEQAVSTAAGRAESREVRLLMDIPEKGISIRVDTDLFIQAVINLINNAVEASPPKSAVTVSCGSDRKRKWCSVTDQGPGLKPGDRDRIFEPFYTGRAEGTGLGLAVARRAAREMGGDIEVESSEQGGSRFVLWLPAGGPSESGQVKSEES